MGYHLVTLKGFGQRNEVIAEILFRNLPPNMRNASRYRETCTALDIVADMWTYIWNHRLLIELKNISIFADTSRSPDKQDICRQSENQVQVPLTHWGRVTHICVSKLTSIGSDNGLSPGRRQAII